MCIGQLSPRRPKVTFASDDCLSLCLRQTLSIRSYSGSACLRLSFSLCPSLSQVESLTLLISMSIHIYLYLYLLCLSLSLSITISISNPIYLYLSGFDAFLRIYIEEESRAAS